MKKINLLLSALIFIAILIFLYSSYQNNKSPQAKINDHIFYLDVVKTNTEMEIGLAKYKNIPQNFGMLFLFHRQDYYSFWMKNMKFPIDIIYIRNNKIVTIFKSVPAPKSNNEILPTYRPTELSDTVLEINSGLSNKYNFKNGDTVNIKL